MKEKKIKEAEVEVSEPKAPKSLYNLAVFSPFRKYKRGDMITDDAEINKILSCHEQNMVNKLNK